jgi:hypothetical protein
MDEDIFALAGEYLVPQGALAHSFSVHSDPEPTRPQPRAPPQAITQPYEQNEEWITRVFRDSFGLQLTGQGQGRLRKWRVTRPRR